MNQTSCLCDRNAFRHTPVPDRYIIYCKSLIVCSACSEPKYYVCRHCNETFSIQDYDSKTFHSLHRHFQRKHLPDNGDCVEHRSSSEQITTENMDVDTEDYEFSNSECIDTETSIYMYNNNEDEDSSIMAITQCPSENIQITLSRSTKSCSSSLPNVKESFKITESENNEDTITMSDLQAASDSVILKLSLTLSRDELQLLVDLLNVINLSHQIETCNSRLHYPTDYPELRRQYIDGKDSLPSTIDGIIEIQTQPQTKTYYIPLPNIIKLHFNFHDTELVDYANNKPIAETEVTLWSSKRAKSEILRINNLNLRHQYIHFLCLLWSDGFDSNSCRKARGQSWCQTITLIDRFQKSTYVLAIGPDSDDNYISQRHLFESLNAFKNGLWIDEQYVIISLIAYVADQPERRSCWGLSLGTSKYHQRWGVLLNHSANSWNPLLTTGSQITMATLKESIKHCFRRHSIEREWNKSEARNFLQEMGFCERLRDAVISLGPDDDLDRLMPPCWSMSIFDESKQINLIFPDAPMHLLFLGCTKTLYEHLHNLILTTPLKPWQKEAKSYIENIFYGCAKMKLDWLHVVPFSLTGGLLSENFLAICRLFPVIEYVLETIEKTHYKKVYESFHSTPTQQRNVAFHRRHLSQMGEFVSGTALELGIRSNAVFSIPINTRMKKTIAFCKCLRTMFLVAGQIMQKEYSAQHIERTKVCISNLLIYMEAYCPGEIISKYNFLSLLNLPTIMEELGPLRNIWEGGQSGEKFLTVIKSHINKNGSDWEKPCIRKVMVDLIGGNICDSVFFQLQKKCTDNDTGDVILKHLNYKNERHRKMLHVYKDRDDVVNACAQHSSALSAYLDGDEIFIQVKDSCRVRIATTPLNDDNNALLKIQVKDYLGNSPNYAGDEINIEPCVLIPVYHETEKVFMAITSSWNIKFTTP